MPIAQAITTNVLNWLFFCFWFNVKARSRTRATTAAPLHRVSSHFLHPAGKMLRKYVADCTSSSLSCSRRSSSCQGVRTNAASPHQQQHVVTSHTLSTHLATLPTPAAAHDPISHPNSNNINQTYQCSKSSSRRGGLVIAHAATALAPTAAAPAPAQQQAAMCTVPRGETAGALMVLEDATLQVRGTCQPCVLMCCAMHWPDAIAMCLAHCAHLHHCTIDSLLVCSWPVLRSWLPQLACNAALLTPVKPLLLPAGRRAGLARRLRLAHDAWTQGECYPCCI